MIGEIIVIVIVALIVIKPERLPEMAYLLGRLLAYCTVWHQKIVKKYNPFT